MHSGYIKHTLLFIFLLLSLHCSFSQSIKSLHEGNDKDSSYYHLARIGPNEFWAAGEYGILNAIDSSGNISPLNLPMDGLNILKIEKIDNDIFILTDNASIFKFNYQTKVLTKKAFPQFKNRCFYDMVLTSDNKILLCGGTTGISKGERLIPHGFIAITNTNLVTPTIVWHSFRKFVWSLKKTSDHKILAATFNGINTKILVTGDGARWSKYESVKGLVHEINLVKSDVIYCGTGGTHYNKNGFIQFEKKRPLKFKHAGCMWSMQEINEAVIAVSQKGKYFNIFPAHNKAETVSLPTSFPIYDIEQISNNKLMLVGHGKTAFIVDLSR